jgi:hypothetical protein
MIIKELKLRNYPYKSKKGLAEKLAKKYFIKKNYEIFKGRLILGREYSTNYFLYNNVKQKYSRFDRIIIEQINSNKKYLEKLLKITKGIPDFFVFRKTDKNMMFVEVKLEHEQIKENQYEAMSFLEAYGFKVMVLRFKNKIYRKKSKINIKKDIKENKKLSKRKILVKQEKIWKKYEKN